VIHFLANEGKIHTLRWLLQLKYEYFGSSRVFDIVEVLNLQSRRGLNTAMHQAALGLHYDVVKLLKIYNADINMINFRGRTPLELRKTLYKFGTDYNYCIVSTSDNIDPKQTTVYEQLDNIRQSWEAVGRFQVLTLEGFKNKGSKIPGVPNKNNYFIYLIKIDENLKSFFADLLNMKIYNNKSSYLQSFIHGMEEDFEPLRDRAISEIILYMLKLEFNITKYTQQKVIIQHFPVLEHVLLEVPLFAAQLLLKPAIAALPQLDWLLPRRPEWLLLLFLGDLHQLAVFGRSNRTRFLHLLLY
jgi:hypothetical protein